MIKFNVKTGFEEIQISEWIEKVPVLVFHEYCARDLFNFVSTNPQADVAQDYPCPLSGEKNNYVFVAAPSKLCIYFKGVNDPVIVDSKATHIDDIEVDKYLTRDQFKELKDALSRLYNHGVDINNPHAVQRPTPLDLKTIAVIKNLISE